MSNQWPSPTYADPPVGSAGTNDYTQPVPIGIPQFTSPIPVSQKPYCFSQTFVQFLVSVSEPALGTAHPSAGMTPDYSAYLLAAEGAKRDIGGGLCQWDRTYATIPDSWDSWEMYSYNYPGSAPLGPLTSDQVGRFRFTEPVPCRCQHDYYAVSAAGTSAGTAFVSSPGNIPINLGLVYCAQGSIFAMGGVFGGWAYRQDFLADTLQYTSAGYLLPSIPSATNYAAMIADAFQHGWQSAITVQPLVDNGGVVQISSAGTTWGGQITAEDSRLSLWQGVIYERQTRYVLAK